MTERSNSDPPAVSFLTVEQVAVRWQMSPKTVRRRIDSGVLSVHRFGLLVRVSYPDLIAYERTLRED